MNIYLYILIYSQAYSAEYWVEIGVPRSKLYVGIPVYAHVYELLINTMNGIDAPAVGSGGDWTYSQVSFINCRVP